MSPNVGVHSCGSAIKTDTTRSTIIRRKKMK